jgi:hypothetical protein
LINIYLYKYIKEFSGKGIQVNKSLRNLSIIQQKADDKYNLVDNVLSLKNDLKNEYSAYKPLYKRYFLENANKFIY